MLCTKNEEFDLFCLRVSSYPFSRLIKYNLVISPTKCNFDVLSRFGQQLFFSPIRNKYLISAKNNELQKKSWVIDEFTKRATDNGDSLTDNKAQRIKTTIANKENVQ